MAGDLFSKKHNIRFFHCPKCAMTSVRHHLDCEWIDEKDMPKNYKTIFVVRNPLDRAVSAYFQLKKTCKSNKIHFIRKGYFTRNISDADALSAVKDPEVYLNELLENGVWDSHQVPQIEFAYKKEYARNIDMVDEFILLENINFFFRKLKVDEKSEIINKNRSKDKDKVKQIFSEKIKDLNYLYKEDYELYRILQENKDIDEVKKKINGTSWYKARKT